jgi:hypothetical protein
VVRVGIGEVYYGREVVVHLEERMGPVDGCDAYELLRGAIRCDAFSMVFTGRRGLRSTFRCLTLNTL